MTGGPAAHPARRALLAACILVLVGLGCPPSRHLRPDGPDRLEDPTALLAAMARDRLDALRVSGTVEMRRDGKRIKAHMIFLTRRPAGLRFETESFFDQPLSILVSDGRQFSAWDMQKGRFIQGTASADNISRVIPVPMDGATVTGMLMGDPPLLSAGERSLVWDEERGAYLIEVRTVNDLQRIWIKPSPLRTIEVRLEHQGNTVYDLLLQDWIQTEGRAIAPGKILFEMPDQDIRLRIRIREAEADPKLEDSLFQLEAPADVQFERWP